MLSTIRESAIVTWVAQQITAVDVFLNSLILKWILKFTREAFHFCNTKLAKAASLLLFLIVLGCVGWAYSWICCLIPVLLIALFALIWRKPEFGIALLVFSFVLAPKIHVGVINSVIIPIRIDDLLLIVIALVTLLKVSLGRVELRSTSLDIPILLFLGIVIISTFRAFFIHTIDKPLISLLYVAKVLEYFLIFYLVIHNIRDEKKIRLCLGAIIVSSVILSLIGIWEHFHPLQKVLDIAYYRIYERGMFYGEANHFGAYLVFLIGIAGGFILFSSGLKNRICWLGLALLILFPLLWTYSRQSYLALLGPIVVLPLFKRRKRYLILMLGILALLLIFLFSTQPRVKDRLVDIKDSFLSKDPSSSSFAFRLNRWKEALSASREYPLLGTGLGSRHRAFYESNQVMVLSELGIVGYSLFLSILLIIFRTGIRLFNNTKTNFNRIFAAGFTAGFIGLVLHSFACNTFMITRIAGPFWIMTGLLFSLDKKNVIH